VGPLTTNFVKEHYVPERGDAVRLSLLPQAGHEHAGRCPCVVLSPARYNGVSGLALFVPITTRIKGYPFEVPLPEGVGVGGVVLTDQVRSLDWRARHAQFIATLPPETVRQILQRAVLLVQP
jgi:mRNA interferase MazF